LTRLVHLQDPPVPLVPQALSILDVAILAPVQDEVSKTMVEELLRHGAKPQRF
jgi:hypothetical protein